MILTASLDLKDCVATFRMTWNSLDHLARIQLPFVQVRMDDVDFDITEVLRGFGSLLYEVCKVFGWLVWTKKLWFEKFDFSLFELWNFVKERNCEKISVITVLVWFEWRIWSLFIGKSLRFLQKCLNLDASCLKDKNNHYST